MKLIVLGIIALLIVGYTALTIFRPGSQMSLVSFSGSSRIESTEAEPMRQAKKLYDERKKANEDFSKSPCLAENVAGGWAVDIVHNPRTVQDEQNKCASYEQKTVEHIVEISPDGKIVRAE